MGCTENRRKGAEMRMPLGAQRGAQAFPPPPLAPLELPVSESYIYWEINTPRGGLFQTSHKTQWGREGQPGPQPQYRPRTFPEDKRGLDGRKSSGHRCLLTSKANNKKGSSKSRRPERAFSLDRKARVLRVHATWSAEQPACRPWGWFLSHTKPCFRPFE